MKKQLFSIDISHYKGKTLVTWWRGDNDLGDNCFNHIIPVKTESTYDRLFRLLPPENAGTCYVHPQSDSLSVSWLLREKQQQEWRRAERDIESAEYDAHMAIENLEREQLRIRKHMREQYEEHQREYDDIHNQLQRMTTQRNVLQEALELAREALEEWHDETTLPTIIKALEYNPQEDY